MTADTLEALRMGNIALTILTALALGVRLNDDWPHLRNGWRVAIAGLALFPIIACYGSVEQLYQGAPIGARTALVTAVCLVILGGLWVARHDVAAPGTRMVPAPRILAVIDHADDGRYGPPCQHPGCMAARAELIRLAAQRHLLEHPTHNQPPGATA